jgi:SHS2 domain-containing protein
MGIRGYGDTIEHAFAQAALAMTAVITDLEKIQPQKSLEVACQSHDLELLFVDWLNALVYHMSVEQMLFCHFDVKIDKDKLYATVWGEHVDRIRHEPAVEVKGATYTELKVNKTDDDLWLAQCIVDI